MSMFCIILIMIIFIVHFRIAFKVLLPVHASELHASVFIFEPLHGAPPFVASVDSDLLRVLVPPPQVTEQVDHFP